MRVRTRTEGSTTGLTLRSTWHFVTAPSDSAARPCQVFQRRWACQPSDAWSPLEVRLVVTRSDHSDGSSSQHPPSAPSLGLMQAFGGEPTPGVNHWPGVKSLGQLTGIKRTSGCHLAPVSVSSFPNPLPLPFQRTGETEYLYLHKEIKRFLNGEFPPCPRKRNNQDKQLYCLWLKLMKGVSGGGSRSQGGKGSLGDHPLGSQALRASLSL